MEKLKFLLLSIIITLAVAACDSDELQFSTSKNVNFEDLNTKEKLGGETIKGSLTSKTYKNDIFLLLKQESVGNHTRIYRIQSEDLVSENIISLVNQKVKGLYNNNFLVFQTISDDQIYLFHLDKSAADPSIDIEDIMIKNDIIINNKISSIGLGYLYGKEDAILEYFDRLNQSVINNSGKIAQECTSGGAGAEECSIDEFGPLGGCSVTCSEGYYACCDSETVKCTCVSNDETIDPS